MSTNENKVINVDPSATFYYERAFKAYQGNNIDKGIKYFKRGISLSRHENEAYYGCVQLVLIYQHAGRFEDSYDELERLIKESHQLQPDLYYFQAVNCSYLKSFTEAKEYLDIFIKLLDKRNINDNPYRKEAEEMIEMIDGMNTDF